ncbi:hypothetical protein ACFL57_00280 [Candidatus Margulisiibacteriota bacterium]
MLKKFLLPFLLFALSVVILMYNPSRKLSVSANIPKLPVIEPVSPQYQTFNQEAQGEKTYLEIETAMIKHFELSRDPFVKTGVKRKKRAVSSGKSVNLRLQGIWDSREEKVAFINGRMLKLSDYISGYRVIRINSNEVELTKYGRKYVIYLNE